MGRMTHREERRTTDREKEKGPREEKATQREGRRTTHREEENQREGKRIPKTSWVTAQDET